jgi:hypothetical protein
MGDLSWTEIRLHCTASLRAAVEGRRGPRVYATPDHQRQTVYCRRRIYQIVIGDVRRLALCAAWFDDWRGGVL